jgi:hypothetical protein
MAWLVYGIPFGSVAIPGSITQQAIEGFSEPNHVDAVVGPQKIAPLPFQGPGTD